MFNGVPVTQSHEHYNYRAYLETLLTYWTDASLSHLSNSYCYLDSGDMNFYEHMAEKHTSVTNEVFIARWSIRVAAGMYKFSGVYIMICVTSIYFYCRKYNCRSNWQNLAELLHVEQNCWYENHFQISGRLPDCQTRAAEPSNSVGSRKELEKGAIPRYNMMSVDLKPFTFKAWSKSRSIDNAVSGVLPKHLTMIKNANFNGSLDTNPYKFRHDSSEYSLYVNGNRVPSEGHILGTDHEKTSDMVWRILFQMSGILHSNTGLQITHDIYINGYFMLLYDLTPERCASEAYTSLPENGNIRIKLQFSKPLPESIICLLYLEYDSSVLIIFSRQVTTDL